MKKSVIGVILIVLGFMGFFGGVVNGTMENLGQNIMYDIGYLGAIVALVVIGIILVLKEVNKNNGRNK